MSPVGVSPIRQVVGQGPEQLDARLRALEEKLDRINHLVVTIDSSVQENRNQIFAARHEAHVLLVTDIDAANEATALLGRSLSDHRDVVEGRLARIEERLASLADSIATLARAGSDADRDRPD